MRKLRQYHVVIAGAAATAAVYALAQYQRRRLDEEAARLWRLLGLQPGARVGEVGAGAGEMARRMALRAGKTGRIFATELDRFKAGKLRNKFDRCSDSNITVVESQADSCGLPPNSCDAIYMRGVYHHFTHPREMDASIVNALRPGGTLAVIDFAPRWWLGPWTPRGIPADRGGHGIRPRLLVEELLRVGFAIVRVIEAWGCGTYCVLAQKLVRES